MWKTHLEKYFWPFYAYAENWLNNGVHTARFLKYVRGTKHENNVNMENHKIS